MKFSGMLKPRLIILLAFISILFLGEKCEDEFGTLLLAPNPAVDYTVLSVELPVDTELTINIYDSMGNLAIEVERSKECFSGDNKFQIDLRNLINGIYFVRVSSGQNQKTEKLIVAR